jgi:hypothetical protein
MEKSYYVMYGPIQQVTDSYVRFGVLTEVTMKISFPDWVGLGL